MTAATGPVPVAAAVCPAPLERDLPPCLPGGGDPNMKGPISEAGVLSFRSARDSANRPPQLAAPAGAVTVATLENVLLAFDPRVVMAAMQTTMIRASMTAYSTAVGPSSFLRNATSLRVNRFMVSCP